MLWQTETEAPKRHMKPERLEAIANGTQTRISSQFDMPGMLFQNKLDALGEAMAHGGGITHLSINGNIPPSIDYSRFGAGLQACADLQMFDLQHNPFTPQNAQHIADGLRGKTELTEVNLSHCRLDAEGMAIVAGALATCPNIRYLSLNDNPLGPEGAAILANTLQALPMLEVLKMKDCRHGLEGLKAVTEGVTHCRRLVELDCSDHAPDMRQLGGDIMCALFEKKTNPNLIINHPSSIASDELRKANRERLLEFDSAFRGRPLGEMRASDIGIAYDLLPGMTRATGTDARNYRGLRDYVDSLPRVDDREHITLADLTEQGTDGRTPLGNPRTWQQLHKVLDKLEAAGERITLDLLLQPNRDGESYLAVGLATAPDTVIPALNQHGIQITRDVLLDGNKPGSHFEALLKRCAGAELFTLDNWQGHTPAEMRQVHSHLPPEQQTQVPLHALAFEMQGSLEQASGRGR